MCVVVTKWVLRSTPIKFISTTNYLGPSREIDILVYGVHSNQ